MHWGKSTSPLYKGAGSEWYCTLGEPVFLCLVHCTCSKMPFALRMPTKPLTHSASHSRRPRDDQHLTALQHSARPVCDHLAPRHNAHKVIQSLPLATCLNPGLLLRISLCNREFWSHLSCDAEGKLDNCFQQNWQIRTLSVPCGAWACRALWYIVWDIKLGTGTAFLNSQFLHWEG